MDFVGKVILVTGASRGIGAAIAKAFATEGAAIIVNYLQNQTAADATVADCEARGGVALAFQADVTDRQAVDGLVQKTLEEFGKIDVLVNNAFRPYTFDPEARKMHWQLDWSDYQNQIDGAVKAAHIMAQAVLPSMLSRSEGSIIHLASNLVARPTVPYHDYTTAKAALIGFSRNLAMELGPLGIRVNSIAPGLVYPTEASRSTKETMKEAIINQTPLGRIATPEDVSGPVLFLASDWSKFMTGQTLYVDGGMVMG
ncbi:MAG: glucose 1-dehydrogenase [Alphaproteobacteria bacterium]|nr:glucose 1-dehydrogenase [Alphaproteobacteria bacterium]